MIISHSHKFIFIKSKKTAGTSLEIALSKLCSSNDIITPFDWRKDEKLRKEFNSPPPQNFFKKKSPFKYKLRDFYRLLWERKIPHSIRLGEHDNLEKAKLFIGEKAFNDYLKFSIVRNPWDHAVSYYNWVTYTGKKFSFGEFLFQYNPSLWDCVSIEGEFGLDFTIRYESLEDDLRTIMNELNLRQDLVLPRAKGGIRKNRSYRDYYDDFTKEVVRRKNDQIIKLFDYQF